MDKYTTAFQEMLSLRGLTDHTSTAYTTYIRAYLNYFQDTLQKKPEDVSWDELREFIYWLSIYLSQKNSRCSPKTAPTNLIFQPISQFL